MSIIAMVVIMFETTIYLAYYKDIVFALVSLVNYAGMYINNLVKNEEEVDKDKPAYKEFFEWIMTCQIVLMSLLLTFILFTLAHDFNKVFYRQYEVHIEKDKKMQEAKSNPSKIKHKDFKFEVPVRTKSFAAWQ